ncbi:GGDEF domain-containing protein [Rhodanobacter sp. AS-Z3]|uniref:GGDEF domain-containing protein n=1 Tax=Rhodanobacter sp. AS-Z3 TaxID=3031330 RepID=UPI0024788545|nr:GGDEF domain-containing protein [Rhodanobacter sp. AS-Z3]WEN16591.1 GGDEF domain-containing protein [Rhodanobacter sp. AS-Z3]
MQIETLSLITAIQSIVLAAMLWMGSQSAAGSAGFSLRLRSVALGVEGLGWGALALQAWMTPAQLLLGGNALNLLAQALVVVAVRMLLGEPPRIRLVVVIALLGWMSVSWFGLIDPNYRLRTFFGSLAILANLLLQAQALLNGRSRARTLMLVLCAVSALLLLWRNAMLWFALVAPVSAAEQGVGNYLYLLFAGMQPVFASIAFLLMYSDVLQGKLRMLARTDALTGVSNRLAVGELAVKMLATAARTRQSVGVLMLDADHFKKVNDRFGHAGGDQVLLELMASVTATLRAGDEVGRVGGEEFVVLAPNTSLSGAVTLGERIRQTLATTPVIIDGEALNLTVSIGVAVALPGDRDVAGVLHRADMALYAAKHNGRDCVMSAVDLEVADAAREAVADVVR